MGKALRRDELHRGSRTTEPSGAGLLLRQESGWRVVSREHDPVHGLLHSIETYGAKQRGPDTRRIERGQLELRLREGVVGLTSLVDSVCVGDERVDSTPHLALKCVDRALRGIDSRGEATYV